MAQCTRAKYHTATEAEITQTHHLRHTPQKVLACPGMPMDRLHHLSVNLCALLNREAAWWPSALVASGSDTVVTEW